MRATRRAALKGVLAVPVAAAVPTTAWAPVGGTVLVHDPAFATGQRLAGLPEGEVLPIAGDRIRFARAVFASRPSLVLGLTRSADALLLEEVGREAGYVAVVAPAALGASGWALAPR